MCLSRYQWTCPHGVSYDSLKQSHAYAPSSVLTALAPETFFRWFKRCEQCAADAADLWRRMDAASAAETDRCEA